MNAEFNNVLRNGYLIEERGGHKITVTKDGDPEAQPLHFRWVHDAVAWVDAQAEPPPETRKRR